MNPFRLINKLLMVAALMLALSPAFAGISVSVNLAPPSLPVYVQPVCPDDGWIWTPGYWAYGPYGYYWVPGTWVKPPRTGYLWTPGYWGWNGDAFYFHAGYWGPHVGYYGGVNYGYGYGGHGYYGGRWVGSHFAYNTAVSHVNVSSFRNVYVDKTVVINAGTRISYNGGKGGLETRPTAQEKQYSRENHVQPTTVQQAHVLAASRDRSQLVKVNGGRPQTLAAARPEAYKAIASQHAASHPLSEHDKVATKGRVSESHSVSHPAALPEKKASTEKAKLPAKSHSTSHSEAVPKAQSKPAKTHAAAAPKPQAHPNPKPDAKDDKPKQN